MGSWVGVGVWGVAAWDAVLISGGFWGLVGVEWAGVFGVGVVVFGIGDVLDGLYDEMLYLGTLVHD